jgi:hypothetical protein
MVGCNVVPVGILMDKYDVAQEIAKVVMESGQPLEDIKYFAKTLDTLWDMKKTEEELSVKKAILKMTEVE